LLGLAYKNMGKEKEALKYLKMAANGFQNFNSVSIYYQSLALKLLGEASVAKDKLRKMAINSKNSLKEEDSAVRHFELSQAYRGLGETVHADRHLQIALEKDPNVILNARIKAKSIPWESGFDD